jgi:hypothetical protein
VLRCSAASRARHRRLAFQLLNDLVDFRADLRRHVLELRAGADQPRMPVAQFLRQIGDLPLDFGLLPGQLLDGRRAEDVGSRLSVAGADHLTNLIEAGIGRGPLGAGDDQLRVEIRHLLRDQRPFLALQEPGATPVLLDRAFRLRDLLAKILQLGGEPLIGPPRRVELGIQLRDDVGVGESIGDACRLVGRFGGEIDDDGAGLSLDADPEPLEESVDDFFVLAGATLLFGRRRLVAPDAEGAHGFRQVRRKCLLAVGDQLGELSGRLQRVVELRIVDETKLLDHLLGDRSRLDHLELAEQTLLVGHDVAEHGLQIGHLLLAVFDDEIGLGRVERSYRGHADHGQRHQQRDDPGEQVLAPPKRA